ncbi:probable ascorbate-specific transmembrane electron transporter 1 [Phalaenopsis equestris]|uniref:probable ascorbate-specific transmembrane electron transporter 1 n=1 Tax=Phalaenopsis equestris TaxID=78828 RepID=UPI0009E58AFD|nr:probable ascorbate-specific transmembrane electron transporter 1 [Phalaenopsis equestris]
MAVRKNGASFRISATPAIVAAQLLAVAAITLMLVWVLHFRGGLSLKSKNLERLLNAHHVLMLFGPVICIGQVLFLCGELAIMAFKTVPGRRRVRKMVHMLLNLLGLVLGVLGLYAIFTVIKKDGTSPDLHSLHSWVGFGTMCLYAIQFLLGFTFFLFPGATMPMRANMRPWHFFLGLVIFMLAIISSATGIIRRFWFLRLQRGSEALVLNFTGIAIILFGITVILSVILP